MILQTKTKQPPISTRALANFKWPRSIRGVRTPAGQKQRAGSQPPGHPPALNLCASTLQLPPRDGRGQTRQRKKRGRPGVLRVGSVDHISLTYQRVREHLRQKEMRAQQPRLGKNESSTNRKKDTKNNAHNLLSFACLLGPGGPKRTLVGTMHPHPRTQNQNKTESLHGRN